jgi:ribonuclease HI
MSIRHSATSTDKIVVYSDAARGDQCSGLGYIISGEVNLSEKKILVGTYTSMEAEYHALVEALRVASVESKSRGYVEAYVDVKPLTSKMRVPDDQSRAWRERRRSFHWLANKFDEWELEAVDRRLNEDAHELAREALFDGRS